MATLDQSVFELIERGIELVRSFEIFNALLAARPQSAYADHQDFFAATANAHFQSIFIIAYLLYDRRSGAKSIRNLLAAFEQRKPSDVANIRKDLQSEARVLNAIADVRGSIFAHRHGTLAPEQVLAGAKLSEASMRSFVNMAVRQLSVLGGLARLDSRRTLRSEFARRRRFAREDTRLVLRALAGVTP